MGDSILDDFTDRQREPAGDGERRGDPGIDPGPLGTRHGLREESRALGNLGEAQSLTLSGTLEALHTWICNVCVFKAVNVALLGQDRAPGVPTAR
jgi:hypothetical protein